MKPGDRAQLHDLAAAVENLPPILSGPSAPLVLAATGTEASPAQAECLNRLRSAGAADDKACGKLPSRVGGPGATKNPCLTRVCGSQRSGDDG